MVHRFPLRVRSGPGLGRRPSASIVDSRRWIRRGVAIALVVLTGLSERDRGAVRGQTLPAQPSVTQQGPLPTDPVARREWLLQRNRDQRLLLERTRRCLQQADSLERLERCRQAPAWQPELDGRAGPWVGCPMW